VSLRELRPVLIALIVPMVVGCAPKITPQQALVEEAFAACRAGSSTRLESVQPDGRFALVGVDAQRTHDCMVRYAKPSQPPVPPTGAATKAAPVMASRLPGTWRGTLKSGEGSNSNPVTVRFVVTGGALRWALASQSAGAVLAADGTATVVDGELRMTGTVRPGGGTPASASASRPNVPVRYAGTLVGDRLEVTGVTGDKQVHVLSVRRVTE
jgi:hypothetical protein